MVRAGWMKPGSPTWCLSSLRHTASRMMRSSSGSSAPARSGLRRSVSFSENRHVRSRPSAVSRIRLRDGGGQLQPTQYLGEGVAAGELVEAVPLKRVDRDVEATYAGGDQGRRVALEQEAVGGHAQVPNCVDRGEHLGQAREPPS